MVGKIIHGITDTIYNRGISISADIVENFLRPKETKLLNIITPSAYTVAHAISFIPFWKKTNINPLTAGAFLRALDQIPFLGAFSEKLKICYDQALMKENENGIPLHIDILLNTVKHLI